MPPKPAAKEKKKKKKKDESEAPKGPMRSVQTRTRQYPQSPFPTSPSSPPSPQTPATTHPIVHPSPTTRDPKSRPHPSAKAMLHEEHLQALKKAAADEEARKVATKVRHCQWAVTKDASVKQTVLDWDKHDAQARRM